jgi:hypothetical protein
MAKVRRAVDGGDGNGLLVLLSNAQNIENMCYYTLQLCKSTDLVSENGK